MKRILSIILFAAMMFSTVLTVSAVRGKFNDVAPTAWYYSDVYNAVDLDIVKDADGTQRTSKAACVVVASDPSVSTRPAVPTPRDDTIVLLP